MSSLSAPARRLVERITKAQEHGQSYLAHRARDRCALYVPTATGLTAARDGYGPATDGAFNNHTVNECRRAQVIAIGPYIPNSQVPGYLRSATELWERQRGVSCVQVYLRKTAGSLAAAHCQPQLVAAADAGRFLPRARDDRQPFAYDPAEHPGVLSGELRDLSIDDDNWSEGPHPGWWQRKRGTWMPVVLGVHAIPPLLDTTRSHQS